MMEIGTFLKNRYSLLCLKDSQIEIGTFLGFFTLPPPPIGTLSQIFSFFFSDASPYVVVELGLSKYFWSDYIYSLETGYLITTIKCTNEFLQQGGNLLYKAGVIFPVIDVFWRENTLTRNGLG